MHSSGKLPEPRVLRSRGEERDAVGHHIRQQAEGNGALNILDAGCGRRWWLELGDTPYTLTGIDIDAKALAFRQAQHVDLDRAILGDLRTVTLEEGSFDVIVCRYVLEHVAGAERVLENFVSWLKPGGIIVLAIPNRDSVRGFVTRITPFRFHVSYKKHVLGHKNAGKPGHGPFPTVFDKVVSRKGVWDFCRRYGLTIRAEYARGALPDNKGGAIFRILVGLLVGLVHLASLGMLSIGHDGLLYIIEKV